MYNEAKGLVKSISAGLVAGLAVASVNSEATKSNRQLKRIAGKTIRKVSSVLGNTEYMFR